MAKNSEKILEVKNLVKKFGGFVAIDDISFSIGEGEILGFLGPNGAGKSTTINCLLGIVKPESGQIKILGRDLFKKRSEIMQQTNYCSSEYSIPWNLTVYECLMVFCKLYSVRDSNNRINELLKLFEISDLKEEYVRELSFGQRARASLAKALLNRPKLLLLDEPMASMDPDIVDKGMSLLKKIQKEEGMSILYTSHNMWEVEQIADNIIFINHGKIVAQGSPIELTQKVLGGAKEPNLREVFIHLSRQKIANEF